jgi:FkbM family methyltransferase
MGMKLLFVMRHSGYVRNFESTLRMLCERGHSVHLAFQGKVKYTQLDPTDIAAQLAAAYPSFSYGDITLRSDGWGLLGRELRLGLDYLRYLEPAYDNAPKLRERATREAPASVLERARRGGLRSALARRALAARLRAMNRAIPRDREIDAYLRGMRPDVLAVTPLIEPGSPQAEYLRSARALGIRTAYCVASWDNLTNKGLIHGPVDLVAVWNDAMKREAVGLHGVPARRVVVSGAAAFDHWFDWPLREPREAFCARVGLRTDRPYVLYLCSSKFVAPEEVPFVRTWAEKIRRSAGVLRDVGILIRPHPQNAEQWEGVDLSSLGAVSVWPAARAATAPVDEQTRSDYFDSMYHSAAVVGINTTAEIESAILGRPVYTLLAPEFRETQEGTLHFNHLRQVNGGLIHVAGDFTEHLAQLEGAVRDPHGADVRCRRFVEAFVRPHGIDVPATPKLVEALEALASARAPRPEREPVWAPLARRRLAPRAAELEREAKVLLAASMARQAAKIEREERRRAREAERRAHQAEKARQEQKRRAERAASEQVERQQRLESLVVDFRTLDDTRRRSFLRGVVDAIPADSFIELHAATPPRKLDYDRADIYLRAATKGETFRLHACAKEPFTVDWIHTRVGAGEVFYDIGANVGVYSLVAAKKPGGAARVFSFEASYANIASLCVNIRLNDVAGQITPMPIALSDRTAMNVFSLRDVDPGAARHALGYEPSEDGPTMFQQPVMTFRLDDVIEWFRLPHPNHIKLDVDGGELAVLEGASRTLASPALHSILVEVSASLSAAVTKVLDHHGLRLQSKISVKNNAGEYAVWYGLFGRDGHEAAARATADQVEPVSR